MAGSIARLVLREPPTMNAFIAEFGPPDEVVSGRVLIYELGKQRRTSYYCDALVVVFDAEESDAMLTDAALAAEVSHRTSECQIAPGWTVHRCLGER